MIMTQEEKAEAYDRAKEKIVLRFGSNVAEEIFSEFDESEDEKIISAIRKAIEAKVENLGNGVTRTACLAWLEKQGESIDKITQRARTEKQRVILTETNGEANIDWDTRSIQDVKLLLEYGLDYIKKLEKQGEHNPADKAEPKFKVGDWVIDKQGIVHQVANVVENVTNHTYGYDIVGGGYFNDNTEGVRLWNISDAKDGDVLVNGSNTFVFHCINDTRLMGYCHVNTNDGRFYDDIGKIECFCLIDAVVNPATKEQCDTLMKAMADAGYTFDFEKKELKEIENEEYDGEDYGIDSLWHAKNILKKTLGKVDGYQSDDGILALQCCMEIVKKVQEDKDLYEKLNDLHGRVYDAYHLEKQGEQKPSDKIEPKFKVGDWCIDNEDGTVFQIVKVLDKTYRYRTNKGKEYSCAHYSLELDARLWNISDANDGDILHSTGFHNDCIFIFNGLDNWKFDEPNGDRAVATGYCCLSVSADNMEFGMQGPDCVEVNTVKPATKIQRDLLFRKIKEAGYEWDAEKKELKKMGQKPTWSEEDESNFQGIIDVINENKHHATDYEHMTYYKLLSWFKSLKDRYVWKPSDEQIEALEHFVRSIGESGFASPYEGSTNLVYSLLSELKKLKG